MMKFTFWDFLAILLVVATLVIVVVVLVIYINPSSPVNPFPYPTLPPTIAVPSLTPTPYRLPATWTPTPNLMLTPIP